MSAVRRSARKKHLSLKAELNAQKVRSEVGGPKVQVESSKPKKRELSLKQEEIVSPKRIKLQNDQKGLSDFSGCDFSTDTNHFLAKYKDLYSLLPGRCLQIELLLTLLIGEHPHQCIHLCGTSGSGKSLVLNTVLTRLKLHHAMVNCRECYSTELVFREVLNQLSGTSPSHSNDYIGYLSCDNLPLFIRLLRKLINHRDYSLRKNPVVIVLDHAESLEDENIPALMKLAELTECRVCVILVWGIRANQFQNIKTTRLPHSIYFPQYSKEDIVEIMMLDCPPGQSVPLFRTFVDHIWNVFQNVCRDLSELRHLSLVLFPKYLEPIESGEVGRHEIHRLWKHVEPFFKSLLSRVYFREVSSNQWENAMEASSSPTFLKIPVYSKYMLLASYLASHNPARTDKRFFSKQKQTKIHKQKNRREQASQHMGPKPVSLDRIMAIFHSIVEEPVSPHAELYCQLSNLVSLHLLAQISKQNTLDLPKYTCRVDLNAIQQVAKSVGFDLIHHLHDFN